MTSSVLNHQVMTAVIALTLACGGDPAGPGGIDLGELEHTWTIQGTNPIPEFPDFNPSVIYHQDKTPVPPLKQPVPVALLLPQGLQIAGISTGAGVSGDFLGTVNILIRDFPEKPGTFQVGGPSDINCPDEVSTDRANRQIDIWWCIVSSSGATVSELTVTEWDTDVRINGSEPGAYSLVSGNYSLYLTDPQRRAQGLWSASGNFRLLVIDAR